MVELNRFELARVIGARALQLSLGAPPLVKPEATMSFIELAQKELDEDVMPLVVLK